MKIYKVHEFAELVGKSTKTLRRWDESGKLPAKRQVSGHRYYTEEDLFQVLGVQKSQKTTVVYCRVSSHGQKDDLQSQVSAMESFCLGAGISVDQWIKEIGGGMNFKRKKFLTLMSDIQHGKIERLIVAHKDRLCRFGFEYFEHMAGQAGCEITVVNQESLSPEQEMVEDLMSIIHTFSCRLYGLRTYKSKIKKSLETSVDT